MLINGRPPRGSLDVLAAELTAAARDRRLDTYLDQPVNLAALSVTAPHPLFVLDVDAIPADDDAPVPSQLRGWRYLIELDRRVVALATTTVDSADNHRFADLATGPTVSSVVYGVHIVEALLRDDPAEFTIGGFDVPALHSGFLQASDANGRLWFLPLGLTTSLHPARLYSLSELRAALRGMAERLRSVRTRGEPVGG